MSWVAPIMIIIGLFIIFENFRYQDKVTPKEENAIKRFYNQNKR